MKYRVEIYIVIFLFSIPALIAQPKIDVMKRQAAVLMNEGRFKEAIDLLNKYVTSDRAKPTVIT